MEVNSSTQFKRGDTMEFLTSVTGRAVDVFLKTNNFLDIRMGEFRRDSVVVGVQLGKCAEVADIMLMPPAKIDGRKTFIPPIGRDMKLILEGYYRKSGEADELKETLKLISELNTKRKVVVPLRLYDTVEYTEEGHEKCKELCQIVSIAWKCNKDSGKLEGTLVADRQQETRDDKNMGGGKPKPKKFGFEDYGIRVAKRSMDEMSYLGRADIQTMRLSECGFFKPVELCCKSKAMYGMDSCFVYKVESTNEIDIVGAWTPEGELVFRDKIDKWAKEFIDNNRSYINRHRPCIAPYLTVAANKIEVFGGSEK